MSVVSKTLHRLSHAIKEECFGLLPASIVSIRCGDQFLGLWNSQSGEEFGEDVSQRSAQPNVKEV